MEGLLTRIADADRSRDSHVAAVQERHRLLGLAWPIVLTQFLQFSMVFVDTLFLGRLGAPALAAQSLAAALANICAIASFGFPLAVGTLAAHDFGREDYRQAGESARHGLVLGSVLSAGIIAAFYFSRSLLTGLGEDPTTAQNAALFLRALAWGVPAQLAYQNLRQFSEGISRPKPALAIAVGGSVANALLDYAWIYGHWGFPALGITGSGLATAAVQWGMLLALVLVTRFHPRFAPYSLWRGRLNWNRRRLANIARLGAPISGALLAEVGFYSGVTLLMGHLGRENLAAHGIATSAWSLAFMIPLGLAAAVSIRVAQSRGREDAAGVRRSTRAGAEILQAVQLLFGIAFLFGPRYLARAYTDTPRLIADTVPFLRIAGVLLVLDGMQVLLMQTLRGLCDNRVPFLASVLAYWGVGLPAGYAMAFTLHWGPKGLWYGMVLSLAVVIPFLLYRVRVRLGPLRI